MEEYEDPTQPFLTSEERKNICDIMRKTGTIPQPATEQEISTIIAWLGWTKQNWPNCMTYYYKDCCFQKDDGLWEVSYKNNDLMFSEVLYGRSN